MMLKIAELHTAHILRTLGKFNDFLFIILDENKELDNNWDNKIRNL